MSCSSFDEVRITTGSSAVRWSARIALSTPRPSSLGSFRSRIASVGSGALARSACGPRAKRKSSASMPSRATTMGFIRWLRLTARSVSSTSSGLSSTSRMTLFALLMFRLREIEEEGRAVARLGVHPDPAVVAVEDALHDRQADAGASELALVMQALEGTEQAVGIGHVEADAVVGDEAILLAVVLDHADTDHRLVGLAGELPRVLQQVLHCDLHQRAVGLHGHAVVDHPLHRAIGLLLLERFGDLAGDHAQVDRFHRQLRTRHARQ